MTVLAQDCMTADALTKVVHADPAQAGAVLSRFNARALIVEHDPVERRLPHTSIAAWPADYAATGTAAMYKHLPLPIRFATPHKRMLYAVFVLLWLSRRAVAGVPLFSARAGRIR